MMPVVWIILLVFFAVGVLVTCFCVFFDQAVFTRKGTIYRGKGDRKVVALTFDDGPSPIWTPQILHELKKAGVKGTFFMIGHHVKAYPDVARQVAKEGHLIANHGFAHSVVLYYTPEEIEEEIKYTEMVIREITGVTTRHFRPPKAWMRRPIRDKIRSLGYSVILWSLNSKDWVTFDHRYIVRFIARKVRNGDILLFHDSGGVFHREGGDRSQTVSAIPLLVETLRRQGFEFVAVDELLEENKIN